VAAIPVSVFYQHPETIQQSQKLVRFCFAKNDETLTKAAEILCAI
jgi:methionine aminotransferase